MLILGGIRGPLITDKSGKIVFLEESQSEETFRPTFLIPGKEQGDLIRTIIEQFDHEAAALPFITVNIDGLDVKINLHYHPGGDGKAAKTATGLGGAICTMCTVTAKEKSDPKMAKKGFPKNRDRDQNLKLFADLKKKSNGKIDTTVPTQERFGMTQEPPAGHMDWTGHVYYLIVVHIYVSKLVQTCLNFYLVQTCQSMSKPLQTCQN